MKRLADISIDQDGEELVFRVKLAPTVREAIDRFLNPVREVATHEITVGTIEKAIARVAPPEPMVSATSAAVKAKAANDAMIAALDREIADFYVAGHSINECRERFHVGKERISAALDRTETPTRAAHVNNTKKRAPPIGPKPKSIGVPADAPRVAYVEPPPPRPGRSNGKRGTEAYRKSLARHFGTKKLNLSPADQARLVEEHFQKGGAITVVKSAPAIHAGGFTSQVGNGRTKK